MYDVLILFIMIIAVAVSLTLFARTIGTAINNKTEHTFWFALFTVLTIIFTYAMSTVLSSTLLFNN